nr:MAG TPA: hypothetical protein [Inoviridae sp.]
MKSGELYVTLNEVLRVWKIFFSKEGFIFLL